MMNPNNPLLVYRKWLLALKLDLADLLSLEIFKSLSQFYSENSNLRRVLESKKQNNNYPGLHASKLIDLIDRLIDSNEKFTNQRTAVLLLSTTTLFLQAIQAELSQNLEKVRQKLLTSIIIDDKEATEHFENELDQIGWACRSKSEIWNSWIKLVKNDFSYRTIHTYLISESSKSN